MIFLNDSYLKELKTEVLSVSDKKIILNKTIFYAKQDSVTLRSYQIYKHRLGTNQDEDVLVYEEADETFSCYVTKSKSKKYIMIGSYHTLSNEYRYIAL